MLSLIALCPLVGEAVGNHPVVTSLVYPDYLATCAEDFVALCFYLIPFGDPGLMAADHMAVSDFFVLLYFFFAGRTLDCKHWAGLVCVLQQSVRRNGGVSP